jgi:hypothetical protein
MVAASPEAADDADTNPCRKMIVTPASFLGTG